MNPEWGFFRDHSIADAAAELRAGGLSAAELTEIALDDMARWQPHINAFVTVDAAGARAAASTADRELAAGIDRGPLHGMPVAVKDMIDVRGFPTGAGSAHRADSMASRDAECVADLRQAGAVFLGKTTTHQFANGPTGDRSATGVTRNPHSLRHMAGGSSSGSAAAVAAGIVPAALGTDTGGSVRIPASCCGVVGLRPTQSALSTDGVHPLARSMDTVGVLARSTTDARHLWNALAHEQGGGPSTRPPRIAWIFPQSVHVTSPQVAQAARGTVGDLVEEEISLPMAREAGEAYSVIQGREAYDLHHRRLVDFPDQYDPEVKARLLRGREHSDDALAEALAVRTRFRATVDRLLDRFDLLAMPTVPIEVPIVGARVVEIGDTYVDVPAALLSLTSPWSVIGLPAISLPAGTIDGLPTAVQLVARRGGESQLLHVGELLARGSPAVVPGHNHRTPKMARDDMGGALKRPYG